MKKLMMAVATLTLLVCSAVADIVVPWFNGGIEQGWPDSARGGAWLNCAGQTVYEANRLLVEADPETPVVFAADESKTIGEETTNVLVSATVSFTPFTELPEVDPAEKAGVIVLKGEGDSLTYWVLAKEGNANGWQNTEIAATGDATEVRIALADGQAIYTIGGTSLVVDIVSAGTVSSVSFSGDGEVSSLGAEYCANEGDFKAKIGSAYYPTISAAVLAVQDGDTVEILSDATDEAFVSAQNLGEAAFTIDLGGHTFTVNSGVIQFYAGADVTIRNGAICRTDGADTAWLVRSYATKVTFEDVTLDATGITSVSPKTVGGQYFGVVTATNGSVEFKGDSEIVNVTSDVNAIVMGNYPGGSYEMDELTFDTTGTVGGRILLAGGALNIVNDAFITTGTRFLVGADAHSFCTPADVAGQGFAALAGTFPTAGTGTAYFMNYTGELFRNLNDALASDAFGNAVTIFEDVEISEDASFALGGKTLEITAGQTLTLAADVTLTRTSGGIRNLGSIAVASEKTLDLSTFGWGAGLVPAPSDSTDGTFAIAGTVKFAAGTDPRLMAERNPGFFEGSVEGARFFAGDVEYVYDGSEWTLVAPTPDPVEPGTEIDVPQGRTVEQFVDDINTNDAVKALYLKAPGGVETTATYRSYFDAVPSGVGKVTFALNVSGETAVATAVEAIETAVLDIVASEESTLTVAAPLAGFYYSLRQGGELDELLFRTETDKNRLAGSVPITFTLDKPTGKGFYQIFVTPVPYTDPE